MVGINAAKIAVGFGAAVIIIDRDLERLRYLDDIFGSRIRTLASNPYTIAESVAASDLVVGAVLVPGAAAPKLVTREMLRRNASWFGDSGRSGRSRRLHRDYKADNPQPADLLRRECSSLWSDQHARAPCRALRLSRLTMRRCLWR